jgi:hypothetical protein
VKISGQLNKIIAVVFLVLLCLCVSFVGYSFAQVTGGLSEGDTFTYQVSSNSNIPLIYQIIYEPKKAESIQIQIIETESLNLRLNITESFLNGTKYSWIQNKNLDSATGFPIIDANFNVNDRLWPNEALSPLVSEVATQTFPNGNREIVYATVPSSELGYNQIDYQFDRRTGMPVEIRFVESNEVSTVLTLADSSVWIISASPSPSPVVSESPSSTVTSESPSPSPVTPEFPLTSLVAVILAIVLVGAIAYKTKLKHN